MPLAAPGNGLIAAQARLIVTLARNADWEQRNVGHEAQAGEMARQRAALHIADYQRLAATRVRRVVGHISSSYEHRWLPLRDRLLRRRLVAGRRGTGDAPPQTALEIYAHLSGDRQAPAMQRTGLAIVLTAANGRRA